MRDRVRGRIIVAGDGPGKPGSSVEEVLRTCKDVIDVERQDDAYEDDTNGGGVIPAITQIHPVQFSTSEMFFFGKLIICFRCMTVRSIQWRGDGAREYLFTSLLVSVTVLTTSCLTGLDLTKPINRLST